MDYTVNYKERVASQTIEGTAATGRLHATCSLQLRIDSMWGHLADIFEINRTIFCAFFLLIFVFAPLRSVRATDVTTYHNDIARTGLNDRETILALDNVNSNTFGKIMSYPVDGNIYAQPLVLSNVKLNDGSVRDLVYVATQHDSIFAFDASPPTDQPLEPIWHTNFTAPVRGVRTVLDEDVTGLGSITPEIGITSTPVIDTVTSTIYLVAKTKITKDGHTTFAQHLHALDAATGQEKFGGPVLIEASVPGNGDGTNGNGELHFNAQRHLNRPGLLLLNDVIYVCWASHGDTCPYHGWIIAYDKSTLSRIAAINTTPSGGMGGVWQSGGAPAVDEDGNIYVITGNGTFGDFAGYRNFGNSFLKLSTRLDVLDFFTPHNQAQLEQDDVDLGSSGALLLPDSLGNGKKLLVGAGKEGTIYLLNRDDMGEFSGKSDARAIQVLPKAIGPALGSPALFRNLLFYAGAGDYLKAFAFTNGFLGASPISSSLQRFRYPGAPPSISSNDKTNAIVWLIERGSNAVLHAFNAQDLSHELYNSDQAGDRDRCGAGIKFAVPTIANGKVYVGTADRLEVFGLFPPNFQSLTNRFRASLPTAELMPPTFLPASGSFSNFVSVSLPTAQNTVHYTLDGTDPTEHSSQFVSPLVLTQTTLLKARAFEGANQSAVTTTIYDINETGASAVFLDPDIDTLGNWVGSYGSLGHHVVGDAPKLSDKIFVSLSGESVFLASTVSTNSNAPQKGGCPDERINGLFFSRTAFEIDLDVHGLEAIRFSLYCWDDSGTRSQAIELCDRWTGALLDRREIGNFSTGLYLAWEIRGHVRMTLSKLSGSNAILNGFYVDPSPLAPRLNVTFSSSLEIVLSWSAAPGDFTVQRTSSLNSPFLFFANPTNTSLTIPVNGTSQFFRLGREQ